MEYQDIKCQPQVNKVKLEKRFDLCITEKHSRQCRFSWPMMFHNQKFKKYIFIDLNFSEKETEIMGKVDEDERKGSLKKIPCK